MPRLAARLLGCCFLLCTTAHAAPIAWNSWSFNDGGQIAVPGTPVTVTFSTTNSHAAVANYPSWTPTTTFADGTWVDNGPVASNGIMQLTGGTNAANTITFSVAVVDPVLAIWSLGQPGLGARFVFTGMTPLLVSGGTNAEYGGQSVQVSGDTVSGLEGNGTVRFAGTFSQISWTNPDAESWYGFNVGIAQAVPEPSRGVLLLAGLGMVLLGSKRNRRAEVC